MKLGVVMDPISSIKIKKDSTFALLLEAQSRGWELGYMELGDLGLRGGEARSSSRPLHVQDDPARWWELGPAEEGPLGRFDVILMRKDPPFNMEYVYATYLLERAEAQGALVVNRPQGLRDANEKVFTAWFPQCLPPQLVTREADRIKDFLAEQRDLVVKPLDGFGGASIFRIRQGDDNTNVIIETLTDMGRRFVMAQRYLPEILQGDKRILLVNGEPVPHALARIPPAGELRGNLATGGEGRSMELSERDRWICAQVGPELRRRGLTFVGLDVIGDYLTEINVTCPTCIRELDRLNGINISAQVLDAIQAELSRGI